MRRAPVFLVALAAVFVLVVPAAAGWQDDVREHLDARQYKKAAAVLEADADLTTPAALALRGEMYFELGRLLDAETDLKAAVATDDTCADCHAMLALVLAKQRAVEQAATHAAKAVELSSTGRTLFARGVVFMGQGNLDKAEADIDAALALDSKNANFHRAKGAVLRFRGNTDGAMTEFNTALKLDPRPYKVYLETASVYVLKGDPVNAKNDINRAVGAAPELYYGYLGRAAVFESYGDNDAALADYKTAIKLAPQVAELYFNQANLLVSMQRFSEAETSMDAAKPYCEDVADWYVMMSLIKGTLKKNDEAEATLNDLVERTGDDWQGFTLRGQFYASVGRFDEAAADFDKAIAMEPEAPEPKLNKVKLLVGQKKTAEALAILNAMIVEHPRAIALYQMRMSIYEAQGQNAAALADLNKIQEIKKQQP